jgi:hypothetical protein
MSNRAWPRILQAEQFIIPSSRTRKPPAGQSGSAG